MIKSFANKHTCRPILHGQLRGGCRHDVIRRAIRRLEHVHLAKQLDDLRVPASNRLHALRGDRQGQYAICINNQWRVCFRFEDGDAYEVEVTD